MSPILRTVRTIQLSETERLDIVRQDGTAEVILSLVEERSHVQSRTAIHLTLKQAHALSRDLAGISMMPGDESAID
jgi:hypothetical protein